MVKWKLEISWEKTSKQKTSNDSFIHLLFQLNHATKKVGQRKGQNDNDKRERTWWTSRRRWTWEGWQCKYAHAQLNLGVTDTTTDWCNLLLHCKLLLLPDKFAPKSLKVYISPKMHILGPFSTKYKIEIYLQFCCFLPVCCIGRGGVGSMLGSTIGANCCENWCKIN